MPETSRKHRACSWPLFAALACVVAQPAARAQGMPTQPGDVKGFAESTFNSPVFRQLQSSTQNQNRTVIGSITDAVLAKARSELPQAENFVQRLKYGQHNVVSGGGETVINWIIDTTSAKPNDRAELLKKLQDAADQNVPEALTFEGFRYEHGIFGAQRDLAKAIQYYGAGAQFNYQPAIYDLAVAAAYGRFEGASLRVAQAYLSQAVKLGPDNSFRVCGLASFISYRLGDQTSAMRFGKGCWSDLAGIANGLYGASLPLGQRVSMLRNSLSTGVDDGYSYLARVTAAAGPDPQYLACKYALVDKYRQTRDYRDLKADAIDCYGRYTRTNSDQKAAMIRMNLQVPGIVGFVPVEIAELQKKKLSSRFHYSWSVPYLPFRESDANLFEAYVSHKKN